MCAVIYVNFRGIQFKLWILKNDQNGKLAEYAILMKIISNKVSCQFGHIYGKNL